MVVIHLGDLPPWRVGYKPWLPATTYEVSCPMKCFLGPLFEGTKNPPPGVVVPMNQQGLEQKFARGPPSLAGTARSARSTSRGAEDAPQGALDGLEGAGPLRADPELQHHGPPWLLTKQATSASNELAELAGGQKGGKVTRKKTPPTNGQTPKKRGGGLSKETGWCERCRE